MPFTFSHPAIVLPLVKHKKLNASALILGSMSPDFEMFIRFDLIKTVSHHFWAMFYFNLPLTLFLFFIFQYIIKDILIEHLPTSLKDRFVKFQILYNYQLTLSYWFWLIVSCLIGIFSHLFWDSFTHKFGLFPNLLGFLHSKQHFLGFYTYTFVYLQFISSILGGLYIIYYVYQLPKHQSHQSANYYLFWITTILFTLLIIFIRNSQTIQQLIATGISASMISLFLSALLFRRLINK